MLLLMLLLHKELLLKCGSHHLLLMLREITIVNSWSHILGTSCRILAHEIRREVTMDGPLLDTVTTGNHSCGGDVLKVSSMLLLYSETWSGLLHNGRQVLVKEAWGDLLVVKERHRALFVPWLLLISNFDWLIFELITTGSTATLTAVVTNEERCSLGREVYRSIRGVYLRCVWMLPYKFTCTTRFLLSQICRICVCFR